VAALNPGTTAAVSPSSATASGVATVVQNVMRAQHLKAVIVKITQGNRVVADQAFGTSVTGVPATTAMHFRNGAVAFAYIGTLLLKFVEQHKVRLDDTIDRWMPMLPDANKITLKMLTNQTSGYPDFETDAGWTAAFNADPFHEWTFQERLKYTFDRPPQFPPGTNWSYSHANFMILGEILAKIGGKPLGVLLQQQVLGPMGLTNTTATETSAIPSPVLNTYSSERKAALGVPPGNPFYEDATYWNTQWGTPIGANETTNIDDMVKTAVKVGTGALLSKSSYDLMTGPHLLGFGHKDPGCIPTCFTQIPAYNYGLGVVRSGNWLEQDPLVSGQAAVEAYLPSQKIAIAVTVTFEPEAFDSQGNYLVSNSGDSIFNALAKYITPNDAPPKP
jgi:CubicO group peptidase (beta-lactamase class C family)